MTILLMLRLLDVIFVICGTLFKNIHGALFGVIGATCAVQPAHAVYYAIAHIRLSHTTSSTALISITGADILQNKTIIIYTFTTKLDKHFSLVAVCDSVSQPQSIDSLFLNARWYERETAEMLGVAFSGAADSRTLLLPYNNTTNPLKKSMPSCSTAHLGFSRLSEALSWNQI